MSDENALTTTERNALTTTERKTLTKCEKTIEKGLGTFVEVGQALYDIREEKLYRDAHATFEAYCTARWELSRSRAYQLIDAAEVRQGLSTIVDILPANEAQTRPLTTIDCEQVGDVWQEVIEKAPKDEAGEPVITAKHVEETVKHWQEADEPYTEPEGDDEPPEEPEPPADQFGTVWSDDAYGDVLEAAAISTDCAELQRIAREWKKRDDTNYITAKFDLAEFTRHLKAAKAMLQSAVPFAMCDCEGAGCERCQQSGWLTKAQHERPDEPGAASGPSEIPDELNTPEFRKAWGEWGDYRKAIKKTLAKSTRTKQLKMLAGWGAPTAVRAIEQSITNGWQGLFDPHGKDKNKPGPGQRHAADLSEADGHLRRICGGMA
jgi:hypothetical protein